MLFFKAVLWTQVYAQKLKPPIIFNLPMRTSRVILIVVNVDIYVGNVYFQNFSFNNENVAATEKIKQECSEQIEAIKQDCDNKINQLVTQNNESIAQIANLQKQLNELIQYVENDKENKRKKRPGPALCDYEANSSKVPCLTCGKGLSDKKALKKHTKALHGNYY